VYSVKGHLATIASRIQCEYNITLPGGVGYAAPMAINDAEDRRLYRLSGFVDFSLRTHTNHERIEALLDAARVHLPDLELIDASSCHRPVSADDRPIIGPSIRYSNLFLCTGFGSRGWSVGLGSGKLLASQMMDLDCDVDPSPYLPARFR
jgi:D-amino-acid dehydrogenase